MLRYLLLILCTSCGFSGFAQFSFMGEAGYMDNGCIRLTPDTPYARGIAYSTDKVNLSNNFEINFDIYLGNKEEGADGIVFVIHNDPREFDAYGTWGECMGYGRWNWDYVAGDYIYPSIAVEFDTYQNRRQNDPACDHVAYLEGGTTYHEVFWNGGTDSLNLEDDQLHNFSFKWNAETQEIKILLDNNLVFKGKRDLVKEIFNNNPEVIWGFTASTGRASNLQYFCLQRLAINNGEVPVHEQTRNTR